MKFLDEFFLSVILCLRKKKVLYITLVFLCCAISFIILTFNFNISKIITLLIKNETGFRTLSIVPNTNDNYEGDFQEIRKIEHVCDVYFSGDDETIINNSSFKSEIFDGTIVLKRGGTGALPIVKSGRNINDDENGVAVCSSMFYPMSNSTQVSMRDLINADDLIGKEFYVAYYKIDDKEQNNPFNKKFKIIGTYDASKVMGAPNQCFVSSNDIEQMNSSIAPRVYNSDVGVSSVYGYSVLVDTVENIEYVSKELKNIGYVDIETISEFDTKEIELFRAGITFLLTICILIIVIITSLFIKKQIDEECDTIAVMLVSGYERKNINVIYSLKTLIINFFVYFVCSVIFTIVIYLIILKIPFVAGVDLMIGGVELNFIVYVYCFCLIVLFPTVLSYFDVTYKQKSKIIRLVKERG